MNNQAGTAGTPERQQPQQKRDAVIKQLGEGWTTGTLGADPEIRFTPNSRPVAVMRLAFTPRVRNEETGRWSNGDTEWYTLEVWGDQAEHVAESLRKGDRVIACGRWRTRTFQVRTGEDRTVTELVCSEIGPSLLFAEARIRRVNRSRPASDSEEV